MPIGRIPAQRITDARYIVIGNQPAVPGAYGLIPAIGAATPPYSNDLALAFDGIDAYAVAGSSLLDDTTISLSF